MLAGAVAIDQVRSGSDWRRYDRQTVSVLAIRQADEIVIDGQVAVRMIGVDAPKDGLHGADQSIEYTRARLTNNRRVTLKLEPTQTRDADGRLLAYVYLSDNDCLNLAMIRDGKAYADRRTKHTFAPQYEQAEGEARKKWRGIWNGLTDDQMPAWRRAWLEQLRRERTPATLPARP